jgi:hypothetical protein
VYGIYNKENTVLPVRLVDNKPVERSIKTKYAGEALFDISHLIKDVVADDKTYLIFEI